MGVAVSSPKKSDSGGGGIGQALGTGLGALAGFVVGGPAGAITGAGLGGSIGGNAGSLIDKSSVSTASPIQTTEQDEGPISRKLAALGNDHMEQLRQSAMALPELDPEIRRLAGPPILQAIQMGSNGQGRS